MQWHPFFAYLLRSLLQGYYDVETDLPVGDLPRKADIVLLRRTAPAPFVGVWRHLTIWNVLEFKGPTDDPALRDLDLLLEVGLGIDRRLNEDCRQQGQPLAEREEVSWWYMANHVGARFRTEAERLLGNLDELGPGLWRGRAFGHPLLILSRDTLPVERESVPLHLVTQESAERSLALAAEVARDPESWHAYGFLLGELHLEALKEILRMNPELEKEFDFDLQPIIDLIGLDRFIELRGVRKVIDQLGAQKVIDQIGLQKVIDQVGVQKVIDQVGTKRVVEMLGPQRVIAEIGLDWFLSHLTPEQLQELKRRLP